jgi:hypothetical protein
VSLDVAALVAGVPDQAAVFADDLAAAQKVPIDPISETPPVRSCEDQAIDGVAHYVFNTLRGAEDTVDGATFEDVRAAIVARGGF